MPSATPAPRPRPWLPAGVLVVGVAALFMLVGTDWIRERLMTQDIALGHVLREIQTRLANTHLWLEELVTGDDIDVGEIWDHLERSRRLAAAVLSGGEVTQDRFVLRPVEDPDLAAQARDIASQIDRFVQITERRHERFVAGDDVGVGSAADAEYDRHFYALQGDLEAFMRLVDDRLDRAHFRSRWLIRSILLVWIGLIALAVTGLWTRERRRLQAEAALRASEAQLLQAQKMEAVGRLAGGMAHDINNYLAAITAHCELVRMKPHDSQRVTQKMDTVISVAAKAASLIQRLLAFSRSEPVQPQVVDLNCVVEGLVKMLERLIGDDIELRLELAPDLWSVKVDPSQIEQVLVNLVVNAREAMATGGEVTVRTANLAVLRGDPAGWLRQEPVDRVTLSVADTGSGIAPEIRDRIFEPFFTTKDRSERSGLGLSTVYGIAQRVGAHIEVASEPGKGATFSLHFPRELAAAPAPEARRQGAGRRASAAHRLLLVEDNHDLRESVREALQELGYRVLAAPDGRQALEAFEGDGGHADLLITDVVMPGMNGRQVFEELQKRQDDLRVIFVSGYTDNVVLRHGVSDEVNFLQKPFTIEQLVERIELALGPERAR